jgi:hypothetical protein
VRGSNRKTLERQQKRFFGIRLLIFGLIFLHAAHCGKPPTFAMEGYYFLSAPDEKMAAVENPKVMAAIADIVGGILEQNPERILKYVSKADGAIIDAKAFVPFTQVAVALTDSKAPLYRVLWDDKYWKEAAPNDNVRSYRNIFSSAGDIRVGIFYYSSVECEVRLDFKNRPSMGVMGNPILRKRGDRWYLMNFF